MQHVWFVTKRSNNEPCHQKVTITMCISEWLPCTCFTLNAWLMLIWERVSWYYFAWWFSYGYMSVLCGHGSCDFRKDNLMSNVHTVCFFCCLCHTYGLMFNFIPLFSQVLWLKNNAILNTLCEKWSPVNLAGYKRYCVVKGVPTSHLTFY